jgi:hypothetical protein
MAVNAPDPNATPRKQPWWSRPGRWWSPERRLARSLMRSPDGSLSNKQAAQLDRLAKKGSNAFKDFKVLVQLKVDEDMAKKLDKDRLSAKDQKKYLRLLDTVNEWPKQRPDRAVRANPHASSGVGESIGEEGSARGEEPGGGVWDLIKQLLKAIKQILEAVYEMLQGGDHHPMERPQSQQERMKPSGRSAEQQFAPAASGAPPSPTQPSSEQQFARTVPGARPVPEPQNSTAISKYLYGGRRPSPTGTQPSSSPYASPPQWRGSPFGQPPRRQRPK